MLSLDKLDEIVHDSLIEISTTQVSITRSSDNLKETTIDSKNGDIKSTTTEIEDQNILLSLILV